MQNEGKNSLLPVAAPSHTYMIYANICSFNRYPKILYFCKNNCPQSKRIKKCQRDFRWQKKELLNNSNITFLQDVYSFHHLHDSFDHPFDLIHVHLRCVVRISQGKPHEPKSKPLHGDSAIWIDCRVSFLSFLTLYGTIPSQYIWYTNHE